MQRLSPKALGFSFASICAVLYAACAVIMATVPKETAIQFFNSLTHGVDWGPIMRFEMPWYEMLIGITEVFILGWLVGATIATLYNASVGKETE